MLPCFRPGAMRAAPRAQGQVIGLQQHLYDGLDLLAEVSAVGQLQAGYTHGPGIDDPLIVRYNN
ncbi:MAG: hypothetical protein Kow0099_04090 [Candidatus Abyssubacteria bacterium]